MEAVTRCGWVPESDPAYVAYHDQEWGVPSHDDRHLFEMLCSRRPGRALLVHDPPEA